MNWVISHLQSVLRKEKMIGTRHRPLAGVDAKCWLSADFSKQRVQELTKAIEVLQTHKEQPTPASHRQPLRKNISNPKQLALWK